MNDVLPQQYRYWKDRFEALSLRERALFTVSAIAVLYIAWDMLLMDGIHAQQKQSVIQIKKWQKQIYDIDGRIQIVTTMISGSKQNNAMRRIEALKSELGNINRRQKALAAGFIRPGQMVDVLKGLLASESGLKLTHLQSQPVESLLKQRATPAVKTTKATESEAKSAPQTEVGRAATALPEVYKHGLEIVFHGNYNSTLSYLKKLEQLPWKFYWDQVEYEVMEYPKAKIMVRIHTLSLDKGWISV